MSQHHDSEFTDRVSRLTFIVPPAPRLAPPGPEFAYASDDAGWRSRMKTHEAEWKARAQREHADAIAALTKPALAILPVSMQHTAQTPGTNLHLALGLCAEMLLPIKQRLDRLDAHVNHDDLQRVFEQFGVH